MEEFALPYNQLVRLEFAEKKGQIWHIGQVKVITKKMKSSKLGVNDAKTQCRTQNNWKS